MSWEVQEGGVPKADVTPVKISEKTEVLVGQTYELRANSTFRCDEGRDGAGDFVAEVWRVIQDHYGVVPFYWKLKYRSVPIMVDHGQRQYWIELKAQFTPEKSESITLVVILVLTSTSFWFGFAIFIIAVGVVFFILKPAGEWGDGLGGMIIIIVFIIALILIFGVYGRGGRKR